MTGRGARGLRLLRPGAALAATAGAVGAIGAGAHYRVLIGLGLALAAFLAIGVTGVVVPVPITVARTVAPARLPRLDSCTATVVVTNGSRWRTLDLDGHDRIDGVPVDFAVHRLGPGERRTITVTLPTRRRGEVRFGPLTVRRRSLGGIAAVHREYGDRATVLVDARILDAWRLPVGARRGRVGAVERAERGGTDLVGLREYVLGDDLRRLHWATSARRGHPMVREDADPASARLTVVLDDDPDHYVGDGFEEAVDVAASLLDTAVRAQSPARLVRADGTSVLRLDGGRAPGIGLDRAARDVLATLTGRAAAGPADLGHHDVLVAVVGASAPVERYGAAARRSAVGLLAVVDPEPERTVAAQGLVAVLRGSSADELLAAWRAVVRG